MARAAGAPSRASRALLSLRNLPLAASVGRRHGSTGRIVALSRLFRALPRPVRDALARSLGRTSTVGGALALGAAGRSEAFGHAITRLAADRSTRRRSAAVWLGLAFHRADLARTALDRLAEAQRSPVLEALTAAAEGHLRRAVEIVDSHDDAASRRLHLSLRSELAVASPEGRAAVAGPAPARSTDAAGAVLHLVTNALPEVVAGYTTRTHGIVAAQRSAGIDAHVVTRLGFPVTAGFLPALADVQHDGVPYHRLLPRTLPRLSEDVLAADVEATLGVVERVQPDVLHAHSKYLNARVALRIRDRTGIPVVYEVRGLLEETWRSRGGSPGSDAYLLAQACEAEAMLSADAVVTISAGLRDAVVDRGVDPGRVVVVPNSVDDRFSAEPPDAGRLRRRLGLAPDDVVVGTLSTLNSYEGLEVLLAAVAELRGGGLPVRALIVGDGPERAALALTAQRLLPPGAAVFTGRVGFGEVHEHHAAIDVFCVPRLDLPVTAKVTPLKPLEALATGRPVVASDLPPLREIVRQGSWGALATPGDPHALASALEPYVTDQALRAEHGADGRYWVLSERTWLRAAAVYQGIYGALRRPGGSR